MSEGAYFVAADENERLRRIAEHCQNTMAKAERERDEARALNARSICVWCGTILPSPDGGAPEDRVRVMWEHAEHCDKRPEKRLADHIDALERDRDAEAENARLAQDRVQRLVDGTWTKEVCATCRNTFIVRPFRCVTCSAAALDTAELKAAHEANLRLVGLLREITQGWQVLSILTDDQRARLDAALGGQP